MLKTLKKQSPKKIISKIKFKEFFKKHIWYYLLVLAFILTVSIICKKVLEAVLFCVAHIIIRKYFDKQFHCGKTATCIVITLGVAFIGIIRTQPLSTSLLSTIPLCCFISWVGYIAQDRVDLYKFKQKKEAFNLDCPTVEQIEERCKLLHYNRDKTHLAIMFFVEKRSAVEVWEYLNSINACVELDTVYKYKQRIKKDLNKLTT